MKIAHWQEHPIALGFIWDANRSMYTPKPAPWWALWNYWVWSHTAEGAIVDAAQKSWGQTAAQQQAYSAMLRARAEEAGVTFD